LLEQAMRDLLTDIHRAGRVLAKSPGFTAVAVATLALGIGANSALFSIVNTILLRPLPYPDPGRIVSISLTAPNMAWAGTSSPHWAYYLWRDHSRDVAQLAAYNQWSARVAAKTGPERLRGAAVAGDFFSLLGARPALGRTFVVSGEAAPGEGPAPVVLSHAAWVRLFGGDSAAIGRSFDLDASPAALVGVLPPSFDFPHGAQFWTPLRINVSASGGGHVSYFVQAIGRLRPGVSMAAARAGLDALWRGDPSLWDAREWHGARVDLVTLHERLYGASRPLLLLLFGAVVLVLLVACANLASMLLARAAAREREFAIRAALGAGRARVVRHVLAESVLLSLLGGAAGLLVAQWGIELFAALAPATVAGAPPIRLDPAVLGFTAAVALAAGVLFGLAPALSASRMAVVESLKSGAHSVAGAGRRPALRRALVVGQLTAALVLVVTAALLARSLMKLLAVDPGFQARGLVAVEVGSTYSRYPTAAARNAFYASLLDRMGRLPGVTSVALADRLPLTGFMRTYSFRMAGAQLGPGNVQVALNEVTASYFATVGATLAAGRGFTAEDQPGSPKVAVVNVAFARRFLGGRNPVGRIVELPNPALGSPTVVGEVQDIRQVGREEPARPEVFLPASQSEEMPTSLVARVRGDPRGLIPAIRRVMRDLDPALPGAEISLPVDDLAKGAAPQRANAILLGLFGVVALLIAGMGLYGLMAFVVAQRTREIGVRVALGAGRRDVLRLVIGQGAGLIALGLALGLAAALALSRVLRGMLFGVAPDDPITYAVAALLLAAIALAATYLPARRALRVDPQVALRAE
jgi:putative ABC transport system permease protein